MKVIKFGGKSLLPGERIEAALRIAERAKVGGEEPIVVVSARGDSTDRLLQLGETAKSKGDYSELLAEFIALQTAEGVEINPSLEQELRDILLGISLLGDCSPRTLDALLSIGERISTHIFAELLRRKGIPTTAVDAGDLLVTDDNFGSANICKWESEEQTKAYFEKLEGSLPVVTGFIARSKMGDRTTLGRNGSNYSATLLAHFLGASSVDNYTHVDGIFTAHPDIVLEARKINELSYSEAAELAQFGAEILHHKTLEPLLEKGIPLRILNTLKAEEPHYTGTLITAFPKCQSLRALASLPHQALIYFEGRDMLGKSGIDARIFGAFERAHISAGMVSQGSTERGIGIVVHEDDADAAVEVLQEEFKSDLHTGHTSAIYAEKNLAVIALVGMSLAHFDRPFVALVRNGIVPKMFNNAVTGDTLGLLVEEREVAKALQVIHGEMFEHPKRVHVAVVGHGTVGGAFIDQVVEQRQEIIERKEIDLIPFAIANSTSLLLARNGVESDWREKKKEAPRTHDAITDIITYAKAEGLENLVLVDNTASQEIPKRYLDLVEAGFDLVSSNKVGNTTDYAHYQALRRTLAERRKSYRYETNVGAGLPLIDNLRLLHLSGDRITRIRGLFSGSLSFIFNELGLGKPFKEVFKAAQEGGYTEPDPRIDLSGTDVARKVLILARELDFACELSDVEIQNLVPPELQSIDFEDFTSQIETLEKHLSQLCHHYPAHHIPRYVGELQVTSDGTVALRCSLQPVQEESALGRVRGADSCFEIFTESYGNLPIVIQGAGAGASVTARGVFGDLLRTAESHPL